MAGQILKFQLIKSINPIVVKSRNINAHRAIIKNPKSFQLSNDIITDNLSKIFEYNHTISIYSKNSSALHIDKDNCMNCLVNIDYNTSIHGTIIIDDENEKLKYKKIHTNNTHDILSFHSITNVYNVKLDPGYILIFDSNYYHSFDCGKGARLILHKFKMLDI